MSMVGAAAFIEVVDLDHGVVHADTVDSLVGLAVEMLTLLVEVGLRVVRQGSQSTGVSGRTQQGDQGKSAKAGIPE